MAFFSAKHLPAECNYDIHDKELLAIVKCLKEWASELRSLSKPFSILTDYKNLEPFLTKKVLTKRQVRWSELLLQFNFVLQHRPGEQATVPDALSRRDQDVPLNNKDLRLLEREKTLLPQHWSNPDPNTAVTSMPLEIAQPLCPFSDDTELQALWNTALQEDERFLKAYQEVHNQERKFSASLELRIAIGECYIDSGILYYRDRIWLPTYEPLTTAVIQKIHDSYLGGHPGRDATIALLTRQFFWPGNNQDVRRFVKNCATCGRTTIWRDKKKGLLKPLPIPDQVWSEISMDFIVRLPPSGPLKTTILLVITDRLSKGLVLIPVPPGYFDTESIASLFLKHYVSHHWIPKAIVSDRGSQFVNGFWNQLCKLLGITQRLSTAYHPETDGATERANQEVETYLRTFVTYQQHDWVDWLPIAQISLCNRPARSTGISPFFLQHGYDARPISTTQTNNAAGPVTTPAGRGTAIVEKLKEAQDQAQLAIAVAQQTQERYTDRGRDTPHSYKVGDKVWLHMKNISTNRPSKKLDWIHTRYTVTKTFDHQPHFYKLDTPKGIFNRFHTSLLRPAANNPLPSQTTDNTQPPAIISDQGDEEFFIDAILDARTKTIRRRPVEQVLVQWTGYARPTWEPRANFEDTAALDAFDEQQLEKERGNVRG